MYGGEGHCIYSRLVYKRRGGWVDIWGGGVHPARGLLGDSVVYQAPLRLKWAEGEGKWVTDIKNTCI